MCRKARRLRAIPVGLSRNESDTPNDAQDPVSCNCASWALSSVVQLRTGHHTATLPSNWGGTVVLLMVPSRHMVSDRCWFREPGVLLYGRDRVNPQYPVTTLEDPVLSNGREYGTPCTARHALGLGVDHRLSIYFQIHTQRLYGFVRFPLYALERVGRSALNTG